MKLFMIFVLFFVYSNATFFVPDNLNSSKIQQPKSIAGNSAWSQYKDEVREIFKNYNESQKFEIQRNVKSLWENSCEKISKELKNEFDVILFVENIKDFLPKSLGKEQIEEIKIHSSALMSNLRNCKKI